MLRLPPDRGYLLLSCPGAAGGVSLGSRRHPASTSVAKLATPLARAQSPQRPFGSGSASGLLSDHQVGGSHARLDRHRRHGWVSHAEALPPACMWPRVIPGLGEVDLGDVWLDPWFLQCQVDRELIT